MATSLRKRSSAPRTGDLQNLPAGGRALPESLVYLIGALAVAALVASFGWVNLRPRNLASEPLVIWKSTEPRMLLDAMRDGLIPEFGAAPGEQQALAEGVPCSQLGESWFRAMPDSLSDRGLPAGAPNPLACDWTPGAQEVIVINR